VTPRQARDDLEVPGQVARLALHEPDPESRLAAAQLLEDALCFIGEAL